MLPFLGDRGSRWKSRNTRRRRRDRVQAVRRRRKCNRFSGKYFNSPKPQDWYMGRVRLRTVLFSVASRSS